MHVDVLAEQLVFQKKERSGVAAAHVLPAFWVQAFLKKPACFF